MIIYIISKDFVLIFPCSTVKFWYCYKNMPHIIIYLIIYLIINVLNEQQNVFYIFTVFQHCSLPVFCISVLFRNAKKFVLESNIVKGCQICIPFKISNLLFTLFRIICFCKFWNLQIIIYHLSYRTVNLYLQTHQTNKGIYMLYRVMG